MLLRISPLCLRNSSIGKGQHSQKDQGDESMVSTSWVKSRSDSLHTACWNKPSNHWLISLVLLQVLPFTTDSVDKFLEIWFDILSSWCFSFGFSCVFRSISSVPLWVDSWLRNLLSALINPRGFTLSSCATPSVTPPYLTKHGLQTGEDGINSS